MAAPTATEDSTATKRRSARDRGLSRRGLLGGAAAAAGAAAAGSLGPAARAAHADAPGTGNDRLDAAYAKRLAAAARMLDVGMPDWIDNGDEARYGDFRANYTKGLPHDALGRVAPAAYEALLAALASGDAADFEAIPLAGERKLVNPQAGLAFDTHGNDPQQYLQPPAPVFAGAEAAGEMVELYWMALLRDVPFERWESDPLALAAADELSRLADFRGPKSGGRVTPATLFRDALPGALEGPYLSQFLLLGTPFGAEYVERRIRTAAPGDDHLVSFDDWLAAQNGHVPGAATFDPERRYVRNGRDLASWVHQDVLFQAYFNACLILGTPPDPAASPTGGGLGCPANPGNPYLASATQEGFGTWGPPFFKTLVAEAARALKCVWFQKWYVHRRLRPEAYAGRVHVALAHLAAQPLHVDVLRSEAAERVHAAHGTRLLPQAFPEGSPLHPSYGAGHATVAGACVTMLKALFDETFEIAEPVVPTADGTRLARHRGAPLTVGGELDKLASNIATGRNHAGVHWRTDAVESLRLGEACAIAILEDHVAAGHELAGCRFTKFDGTPFELG